MDVSPNALRKETLKTLKEVTTALDWLTQQPDTAKNRDHYPMIAQLLLAKSQCYNTLALLQGK